METKNIIYREDIKNVDNVTGEVVATNTRKLLKVPRTPDFIMLYTKHIALLEHLVKSETTILFEILSKYVGVENIIFLSPAIKKGIVKKLKVDNSYINRAIRGLKEKKVIFTNEDGVLFLNPNFFGKGNWEDIHKLRHEVAYDFNFETLEVKETRKLATTYDVDFDMKQHEIVATDEYSDENGVSTQEITVMEKEEPKQEIIQQNSELEILKAQKEIKELVIEEMKLKLEMHKLGLS